jgi:hypothetical protein
MQPAIDARMGAKDHRGIRHLPTYLWVQHPLGGHHMRRQPGDGLEPAPPGVA